MDLRSLQSPQWQNGEYLKTVFRAPSPSRANPNKTKKLSKQIPKCLLAAAKTLEDRLVVVDVWCSLSKEEQRQWPSILEQNFYMRASRFSDEPVPDENTAPNRITTRMDSKRQRLEAFGESQSCKIVGKEGHQQPRHKAGRPMTSHQIYDGNNQRKEVGVHKSIHSLIRTTTKVDGATFPGSYDHVSVVTRNLKDPRPSGKHSMSELILAEPHIMIIARDDTSAIIGLGQARYDELIGMGAIRVYPSFTEEEEEAALPSEQAIAERSQRTVRTAEETGAGVPVETMHDEDFD